MRYATCLIGIGVVLIAVGALQQGWTFVLCWLGFSFLWLGIAHARGAHRAFGKRADGTIPGWLKLLHLPFLCYTTLAWHGLRLFSREPAFNQVNDDLVIGRRLLPSEVAGEFANYVDLTAEFEEPKAVRQLPGYVNYPILDAAAPSPDSLRAMITRLRPGKTYIHCAQGHGRTGLFALAVLLSRGAVSNVEEGLRLLTAARPGIHLNAGQRKCIEAYAKSLSR